MEEKFKNKRNQVRQDRSGERRQKNPRPMRGEMPSNVVVGRNAVAELIRSGAPVDKILVSGREGSVVAIIAEAKKAGIVVVDSTVESIERLAHGENHQGIAAMVAEKAYSTVEEILAIAEERGEKPLIVVCDGINDPGNLGAIIRSAEIAGAYGVIIPKRRSAGLSPAVFKASAGALAHLPVARTANITATLKELKEAGLWIFGTDAAGDKFYYDADLKVPAAIVIGSEGEGMSRLVTETCDFLVKIPMLGQINSLNASCAAAVLLFESLRQRGL